MKRYTIKEGNHSSGFRFCPVIGKKRMVARVIFDDSCEYVLPSPDHNDWNKLFGWSYGIHQRNSVRWGWRFSAEHGMIEVAPYLHTHGVTLALRSYVLGWDVETELSIIALKDRFVFDIEPEQYYAEWSCVMPWLKVGYKLWPYFGGNRTAPHDIHIEMDIR